MSPNHDILLIYFFYTDAKVIWTLNTVISEPESSLVKGNEEEHFPPREQRARQTNRTVTMDFQRTTNDDMSMTTQSTQRTGGSV